MRLIDGQAIEMTPMCLTPFSSVFRAQGKKETRIITTRNYPGLPDDEYALIESYCADPECHCRRVMISVVGRSLGEAYLASVGFGFDREGELAGPFLDPLTPRTVCSDTLLALVAQALADPCYVARLESHYCQIKRAAADPQDPAYDTIRRFWLDERRREGQDGKPAAARSTARGNRRKK